jgi:hypothetical protein
MRGDDYVFFRGDCAVQIQTFLAFSSAPVQEEAVSGTVVLVPE